MNRAVFTVLGSLALLAVGCSAQVAIDQGAGAISIATQGSGSVASSPAGISCGSTCIAVFAAGVSVTLTATPTSDSSFTGWSGACSGTIPVCTVITGSSAVHAAASFTLLPPPVLPSYRLTGNVSGSRGPGTLLLLSGAANLRTLADASGNYGFSGLHSGSYVVKAERSAATFAEQTHAVALSGADAVAPGFTAIPNLCTPDGWCWETPSPQGNGLVSLWGSSDSDIWAVGENSTILHFDGQTWSDAGLWTVAGTDSFSGVWGSGPADVWITGNTSLLHYDGVTWLDLAAVAQASATPSYANHFRAIWGSGPANVWVAGWDGVYHYDGAGWTYFDNRDGVPIMAIWGSGGSDVFTSGFEGGVRHFNGTAFTTMSMQTPSYVSAFWGAGPNDVWAVGDRIERYDGTGWTVISETSTTGSFFGIAGSSDHDLWLSTGPAMVHWDGAHFTPTYLEPMGSSGIEEIVGLHPIWSGSSTQLWSVGDAGQIYRYDGHGWSPYRAASTSPRGGLWGSSANDIWSVSIFSMLHYDGAVWSVFSGFSDGEYVAIAGSAAQDAWTCGAHGKMSHWDGARWKTAATPNAYNLQAIWAGSATEAWAADDHGNTIHWNGTAWSAAGSTGLADVRRLWASGPNDVYAIGLGGRSHWNGTVWSAPVPPPMHGFDEDIWGSGPNDVYMSSSPWLDGSNVTHTGTLQHWDGTTWSALTPGPASGLVRTYGAIGGSGPNDVWVTQADGAVLHFDGAAWTQTQSHASAQIVFAPSPGAVWLSTGFGFLRKN